MSFCSVPNCQKPVYGFMLCNKHYQRFKKHGDPLINKRNTRVVTGENSYGHIYTKVNGVTKAAHVRIVESVIGRNLVGTEIVHHVDGNPGNNNNANLVVCPSQAYHFLLHRRQRALDATGDASKMKCVYCKKWDSQESMRISGKNKSRANHKECEIEYRKELSLRHKTTQGDCHG